MRFEWDSNKARANLSKHGVSFEDAMVVFDDPLALSVQDRYEGGEERWQTLGMAGGIVLLMVALHGAWRVKPRSSASSQQRGRQGWNGGSMSGVDDARRDRLQALAADESKPDTSDAPELSEERWKAAKAGRFFRTRQDAVELRVDADIVDWFRRATSELEYETAINDALRAHIVAHRESS